MRLTHPKILPAVLERRSDPAGVHAPEPRLYGTRQPPAAGTPAPPADPDTAVKNVPVQTPRQRRSYLALSLIQAAAVGVATTMWLRHGHWSGPKAGLLVLASFIVFTETAIKLLRWLTLGMMRRPVPQPAPQGLRVAVVTTFVPGHEPLEMLQRTLVAMRAMDVPHDTWVLDEADDPTVRDLCDRLGVRHFTRKGTDRYQADAGPFKRRTKYGNVNAWLDVHGYAGYDVVAAFDPDHIPAVSFLSRALGYFNDSAVGYVQFPQVYYNQSAGWIARGAAEETYQYYAVTQPAAHAGGWPNVVGCHNVHRMTAMRQVGGFAAHDADDMLIGLLYQQAGWRGVYDPVVVAKGLTPTTWPDYLKQQARWTASVFDVKLRIQPTLALGISRFQKFLNYVLGLAYLQAVLTLLGVVTITLLLAVGPTLFDDGVKVFTSLVCMMMTMRLASFFAWKFVLEPNERGLNWRAMLLGYAKFPLQVAAFIDVVLGRCTAEYTLTNKVTASTVGTSGRRLQVPHLAVLFVLGCGLAWGMARGVGAQPVVWFFGLWLAGMSLCAVVSERWSSSPVPYDDKLAEAALAGFGAGGFGAGGFGGGGFGAAGFGAASPAGACRDDPAAGCYARPADAPTKHAKDAA